MKFCFATLGCKVNQFETQGLAQLAQQRGHVLAKKQADVCIINTCTVTSSGDHKTLRVLHKLQKENPNAIVALCGCFAQTEPEQAAAMDGVHIVCGTSDRAAVLDLCEQAVRDRKAVCTVTDNRQRQAFEQLPAGILPGHTRALLKVQDGCDNYCTYCIIPYARGHVRSLPLAEAVKQAQQLAASGVREIVVTGIEIASYGRDLPDTHRPHGAAVRSCTGCAVSPRLAGAAPDYRRILPPSARIFQSRAAFSSVAAIRL